MPSIIVWRLIGMQQIKMGSNYIALTPIVMYRQPLKMKQEGDKKKTPT